MALNKFSVPDYVVFALMLLVSAFIGFFYAWKDRKKKNTDDFLLGGRSLSIFPVAMSILASFTSAVAILGFSQEMYRFGTMYWLIGASYFLTQPFAAHFYVPLFHRLNITSAYEYLELRFDRYVRYVSSAIFCLQMFLYMAVVLYAPSLAIEQVTGFPLWASILSTGVVCTIYTSLGGMKAVIWTDTFQVAVMFAGLIAIIIKGSMVVGGIDVVWMRAYNTNRIDFLDFNPNPFTRHSFWTLIFGGFFTSLTVYGSNQATIQRYLTVKTPLDAIKAIYMNLAGSIAILSLTCLTGLVAFAVYYDCDLLSSGKVIKGEQILPYLVMDLLGNLPGLPGLFIACVYSAALSTVSSGLNSLAAVVLKDFIQPFYLYRNRMHMNDVLSTSISKFLGLGFGAATVGLAYLCEYFGNTVLQIALSIFGMLGGPLLGVISLGMFIPQANNRGALVGLIVSTILNMWVGIGATIYATPLKTKPMSTEGCPKNTTILNYTTSALTTTILPLITTTKAPESLGFKYVYKLSYLHYSGFAVLICFTLAMIISAFTGFNKWEEMDSRLFINYPWMKNRLKIVPEKEEKPKEEDPQDAEYELKELYIDRNKKDNDTDETILGKNKPEVQEQEAYDNPLQPNDNPDALTTQP